ncbi:hypothetical protein LSH36_247g03112 [Paralvinella palmiformis]|uniref:Uncharacterized protein n=1 Tax=Paralvinella palmiformis TaxID=53620 RepID=A0AAD9JL85_9ANNE|nr:hypothetical protein LSH36_247g03112 [Paralvinella palmiformis]
MNNLKCCALVEEGVGKSSLLLRFSDNQFQVTTEVHMEFLVVYDVTNGESFANVKRWLREIDQNCEVVSRILVGNKDDDPSRKVVNPHDARAFASQMGIDLFETSAKENKNVEEMFMAITRQVLKAKKDQQVRLAASDTIALTSGFNKKSKKKCC